MTTDNFKIIIGALKATYRNFGIENAEQFNVWFKLLSDIPFEVLKAAVYKHMMESEYPPTIASLRKACMEVLKPDVAQLNASSAWEEVTTAIRRFGMYRETDALNSMGPVARKVVMAMSWRELCLSENQMADRAHFLKMFDAYKDREQKQALLPDGLKQQIEGFSNAANQSQKAISSLANKLSMGV